MTLRDKREQKGLMVTEVANLIGVPYQSIQKYEKGERAIENMTLKTAKAYAQALGMTLEEFSMLG